MTQPETPSRAPIDANLAATSAPAHARVATIVILWALVAGGGLVAMNVFASQPGNPGRQARNWPADTAFAFNSEKPNLFMFLHPMCPCSRASMESLMRLTATCKGRVNVTVVFVEPVDAEFSAIDSPLYNTAQKAPSFFVRADPQGREAERFGAKTSGHVLLYSGDRSLLFSGGITLARGHNGDNPGLSAVESWILSGRSELKSAPVHGCLLSADADTAGGRQ